RAAEGTGTASFMRVPFKFEQSFKYASVNATDPLPPMPPLPPARARAPDSLTGDALQAWRDSVRAVRAAAHRDSLRAGLIGPKAKSQCDTSSSTLSTSRRFGDTDIRVATRTPCDQYALEHSPDLPPSIFDPGDELFDLKAREALIAEAL